MDINLKQHLKELEESHIKIDVRKSREIFGRILADDFLKLEVLVIFFIEKNV